VSFGYGTTTISRTEQIAMIRAAYERGVTLFDTAEAYGPPARPLPAAVFRKARRGFLLSPCITSLLGGG
jgi:aryl-alcohol dehydrogenase-like predicted oxidoreductase